MNGIVRLKHIQDNKKVCYYSVIIDQDDCSINDALSLYEKFLIKNEERKAKLYHILSWIDKIGDYYGAQEQLFRPEQNEGEAVGLPPKAFKSQPVYIENDEAVPNNLRLYAHRLNQSVVILFCGGLKTTKKAQDCPNVKDDFKMANFLTNIIDKAFTDKNIWWSEDYDDIEFDENLVISF